MAPRRRQPAPDLRQALQAFRPAASPIGGGPTVGRLDLPIYDFSAISETLTGYLADQAKKDAEKKIQAGERWAVENPQLVAHIEAEAAKVKDAKARSKQVQDAFAFLQRNGEILPAGDPYWQVGYARAAGRQAAGSYRDALSGRLNDLARVRDPETGQVTSPPDVDQILAEEWEKVQNNPAVQNFYGGQAAIAEKAGVDEEFRSRIAVRRAEAQEKDHLDGLATDIGSKFDAVLAEHPVVTAVELQGITDFLTEEVRGHNVMDPRGVAMQALELSIQRAAAIDGDEGIRAVHAAQDLVVGGVRLGDDRGPVGLRLQELTRRVREDAKNKDLDELKGEDAKRRLAIQKGEGEYVGILNQARRDGQSLQTIGRRLAEDILTRDEATGEFGGRGAFVVDAMEDYIRLADQATVSDQAALNRFAALVAEGNVNGAEALALAEFGSGRLTGEDYAKTTEILKARRDLSAFVEENPVYTSIRGRYDDEKPRGFSPEVQERLDSEVRSMEIRMTQDYTAFVRTTAGQQNREELHRAWLEERWQADQGTMRKVQGETRTRRSELDRDVRQRFARFQDAEELIARGLEEGTVTISEAEDLRGQNREAAAGRQRFQATPDFKEAAGELERRALASLEPLAINDYAQRELRDRLDAALDDFLGTADPRSFDARARTEVRRIQKELTEELFPSRAAAATTVGLEAGAPAGEAAARGELLEKDLSTSKAWASAVSSNRQSLSASMFEPVQGVPRRFYDYAAAWMSGRDPIFGRPVDAETVEFEARKALLGAEKDAQGAILSIVGISPQDLLRGRATIGTSPTVQADVDAAIERIRSVGGAGRLAGGRTQAELQALEAIKAPVEIDLEGVPLNPYTTPWFRTEEAAQAFRADPAFPDFLRRLGIDPDDEEDVAEWETQVNLTIRRINP